MTEDEIKSIPIKTSDNYIYSELVISEQGNMIVDYKPPYRKKEEK